MAEGDCIADNETADGRWFAALQEEDVFMDVAAQAQRHALAGVLGYPSTRSRACRALRSLARRWRRQMRALRAIPHAAALLNKTAIAGRCQPATVRIPGVHRTCNMEHFCPWCWSRSTSFPLFKKLQAFLRNGENRAAYDLLLIRTSTRFLARTDGYEDEPTARSAAEVIELAQLRKREIMRRTFPRHSIAGASTLLSVAPVYPSDDGPVEWEMQNSILAIVPKSLPTPEVFCPRDEMGESTTFKPRVTRYSKPSGKKLASIVGVGTQFPKGLLGRSSENWHEDEYVAEWLVARHGRGRAGGNWRQLFGMLRERGERRRQGFDFAGYGATYTMPTRSTPCRTEEPQGDGECAS